MNITWVILLNAVTSVVASAGVWNWLGKLYADRYIEKLRQQHQKELEDIKAVLQRSGRIHERQVDALLSLYANLERGLFYAQRIASPARFAGESEEKNLERMGTALAEASNTYSANKLLFGEPLQKLLNEFFDKTVEAGIILGLRDEPSMTGEGRAKAWNDLQDVAYKQLQKILNEISKEARTVIHS